MASFCLGLFIPGPVTVARLETWNNCPNSGLRTTQPNYKLLYKLPYLFILGLFIGGSQTVGKEWKLISNHFFIAVTSPGHGADT